MDKFKQLQLGQKVTIQGKRFKVLDKNPSPRNYKLPKGRFDVTIIMELDKTDRLFFLGVGRRTIFQAIEKAVTEKEELGGINIINQNVIDDNREIEEEEPIVDLIPFGNKSPF